MGIAIPQVITETKASGAQVVDGSLKFDGSQNLQFIPGSAGDTKTWTWSGWVKRTEFSTLQGIFSARSGATGLTLQFGEYNTSQNYLVLYNSVVSGSYVVKTSNQLRDTGWYHIVLLFDTTQNTDTNRLKIYINGTEAEYATDNRANLSRNSAARVNEAMNLHCVGSTVAADEYCHAIFSQVYFIDGYGLGPEQFGYTDPLTNTWRPKAYDVNLNTYVNNGSVWSDSWDGTGSTGTVDNPARAFNGDLSNFTSNQNSGTICNWVPPAPIPIKRSLRIYASAISSGNNQVFVNGTTIGSVSGTAQWYNIQATELTSIGLQDIGSTHGYLHAVEVDGVILEDSSTSNDTDSQYPWGRNGWHLPLDGNSPVGEDSSKRGNDWTPDGFGGSVALDNPIASGALPILNTTQGGTQATVGVRTDPHYANLVCALPLVGGAADVSNQINGGSTTKATTTSSIDFSSEKSLFYNGSAEFNDQADYITLDGSSDFAFGTGDFTIESWVYPTGGFNFYDSRPTNTQGIYPHWEFRNGTDFRWKVDDTDRISENGAIKLNTWSHVAVVRNSGTTQLYVNGVATGSSYSDSNDYLNGSSRPSLSGGYEVNYAVTGYRQDFRVYKGLAKYTSDFVIASTNPDIRPDTPSGVSGSSKLAKITSGSFASPDSRDALQVQDSDDLAFGTGQFTVEMFFYSNTVSGNDVLYDSREATGGTPINGFSIVRTGNQLTTYSGGYKIVPSTFRVESHRWYHLAITRDSNDTTTQKMYVDGVLVGSVSFSNDLSQPKATIGSDVNGAEEWDGFIHSFRLVKGTALYTANFTPPTAPLTNVTNTKLLCCQSSTSHTEATVIPDVTQFPAPYSAVSKFDSIKYYTTVKQNETSATTLPVGNPSHYGGKALDLASGGFQITTVNSAAEDFFMGMWVHFDTYETSKQFGVDIAGNYVYFETQSNGTVKIRHTGDGGSTSTTTELNDGNWNHVALSRTNDTLYGFVNGAAVISDSGGTGGNSVAANSKFNFWGADNNFTSYNIDGQIIDAFIYIGKGVSSYTTPNAPLVGSDGTINHFSGFTDSDAYYISPCVDVTGSSANSLSGFFKDVAGASTGNATNFTPFNTDINQARGQETGYCTLNPLDGHIGVRDGGLRLNTTSGWQGIRATHGMNSGKFYWETQNDQSAAAILGMADVEAGPFPDGSIFGAQSHSGGNANPAWTWGGANRYFNGSESAVSGFSNHVPGDVVQYAFDADNGNLWFGRNGIWYNSSFAATGNPATGANPTVSGIDTSKTYVPCGVCHNGSARFNFGQKPFKFSPPDGFQPINSSTTRPENVIADPSQYVGIVTFRGTGTTSQSIRGLNFNAKPDLVWIKDRDNTYSNRLADSVRGSTRVLFSDQTNTEQVNEYGTIDKFTLNGFDLRQGSNNNGDGSNTNNADLVAWCWRAGGSKNTFNIDDVGYASAAACGLDGGTITPTGASVGTKQGFSILKYSGASGTRSISHGLSQAPTFIIVKCTSGVASQNWTIYHKDLPTGDYLKFTSDEKIDYPMFNDSHPNSSTIPLGNDDQVSGSSGNYILYAWHDVPGLQKFGSYQGIDTDPLFVNLGFRPALLVIKFYDGTDVGSHAGWKVIDNQRNKFNIDGISQKLEWNTTNSENGGGTISTSEGKVDFLSNGFRIRDGHAPFKTAGRNYIYCAWAEAPQYNLFGGQSNAR